MSQGLASQERAQALFAANRATGHVALSVQASGGRSRRGSVHESGSLRLRFPNTDAAQLEAVILNTAGGMTGGDRFGIEIDVGAGANLLIGTTSAEKIYRALQDDVAVDVKLKVGGGAHLAWLPQETILFDRARYARRIDVDLDPDASLVLAEAVVFGRAAMGETVAQGYLGDRWRVRRGGRLIFAENLRLDGGIDGKLAARAIAAGRRAIATILIAPGADAHVEAVRALEGPLAGEVAISCWNGIAVTRFCAPDGASLRQDVCAVLAALNVSLPRLWLN
ncbi:MAG: urease accessory protein UreD [Pseudolabrys sp.]